MIEQEAKHCVFCGNTHSGDCSDDYFAHFQCECGQEQKIPYDVIGFMSGMVCGCGRNASESWKSKDKN